MTDVHLIYRSTDRNYCHNDFVRNFVSVRWMGVRLLCLR